MAHWCRIDAVAARDRLSALGMTQTALAARCDVELRTLQRWLAGSRTRLDDAERVAAALGLGTAELFDGVPDEAKSSPFNLIRAALRLVGAREWAMAHALRTTVRSFEFIDEHASLTSHPRRGYVRRAPMASDRKDTFAAMRLRFPGALPSRLTLGAQIGRSFRYDFAEMTLEEGEAELIELFHTRSVRAPLDPRGSVWLFVWVAAEVREFVIMADGDLELEDHPEMRWDIFDVDAVETRHAVCSRPSAVQLRAAGLPAVFDRLVGDRRDRVDVARR